MQFRANLRHLGFGVLWAAACLIGAPSQAFETRARAAVIYDQSTSTVLMEKDADRLLPPASMSKLMTLYMAFDFIKSGQLRLDEKLPVSEHAAAYGGSTMFLDTTDRVSVEDLLMGIIVLSGNDACAVIAEALSPDGTEAGFAKLMTQRARQIGLTKSTFVNSNGWPAAGHLMTMRDLATLADRLITDFPEFYPMFSAREFKFDGRAPANTRNRNPLLGLDIGADGLKTGHTQEAGYGLVGSALQDGRRVIFVLSGLDTMQQRADESEAVVNWAFRQFAVKTYGSAGDVIAQAPVWNGASKTVGLRLTQDASALVPILSENGVTFSVEYDGPLAAPLEQGREVAQLIITVDGLAPRSIPLVADQTVEMGGVITRLTTAAKSLIQTLGTGPEGAF
ncbi:MAG: D-alanyl-D-alanine carboxypeptidase [Rhodobacteraceae bacterium]|jgi:D-alanyl-D-alanine carboxypeptidase (penicillin-binding protein 5/6)|nr:D-alanyl-D-alanine carboxypeptidase [Paracoccaceae bacterium]